MRIEKAGHEAFPLHQFGLDTQASEKKVNIVFALTFFMMIAEISAGTVFGSMALLADGWHMFTHAAAFAIALFVYWYAKRYREDSRFSFGTGKVTSLGGFASAVALLVVALMMGLESIERLLSPKAIQFNEAILVACLGLAVNVVSAVLLHDSHHHSHGHGHGHHHGHEHHHDHNLKAAYFHVLADTLTSLFAIVALIAGKFFGWFWADAVMGIIGALVISKWALNLIQESGSVLLDRTTSKDVLDTVRQLVEVENGDSLTDFHYWRLSSNDYGLIISVNSQHDRTPSFYKERITNHITASHITVEINQQIAI